jgi:hypothetical protein
MAPSSRTVSIVRYHRAASRASWTARGMIQATPAKSHWLDGR